jgi:putative ABC transport system substrate-binding protein
MIGFLGSGLPYRPEDSGWIGVHEGLANTGYFDGQNLAIEYRFSEGHDDRLPGLAAELVGHNLDLIATSGNSSAALAAKAATSTIPIVFVTGADPVATGVVASLARPGGNVTGLTLMASDLNHKRLELLAELVPSAKVIAVLVNPNTRFNEERVRAIQEAARVKGLPVRIVPLTNVTEFDPAFASLAQSQAGAVLVSAEALFGGANRQKLIDLTARYSLPAIYEFRDIAVRGGLISYGADLRAAGRREGFYIGSILKGAKPADLPVEQPTKFELVINLKTAKALGLTVPQLLLAQADEVIE